MSQSFGALNFNIYSVKKEITQNYFIQIMKKNENNDFLHPIQK